MNHIKGLDLKQVGHWGDIIDVPEILRDEANKSSWICCVEYQTCFGIAGTCCVGC